MSFLELCKTLLFPPRVTHPPGEVLAAAESELEAVAAELRPLIRELCGGRSLRMRAVDAGSTNAEELEFLALNNAYYDLERFGLSFVASPRHADILLVSGPVVRNLEAALRATYEAAPQPCIVVAVGDGACTGGIWRDSYAVVGPVEKVIPVHIRIPGDPPSPAEILRGLVAGLRGWRRATGSVR